MSKHILEEAIGCLDEDVLEQHMKMKLGTFPSPAQNLSSQGGNNMKLKAPQNKWFLAFVATAVVAAIAIVLAIIGLIPKQPEDISYVEGPETGVYYYDVVEGEVQLTLSGGCNFAIAGPWINKTGTYTVDGNNLVLDFFKDEDGTTTATINGDNISLLYDNATMNFQRKLTYKVDFQVNGGSAVDMTYVVNGKTAQKPADPTKEGHIFLGWYADAEFTTPYIFDATTVKKDTTIYARWAQKQASVPEYTVDFDLGYEGAQALAPITTIGGMAYGVVTPERAGYTFGGWWISMYEDGQRLSYAYTDQTVFTADTTLFALWHDDSSSKLQMPAVSVTESVISWNAVQGAGSYKLTVVGPDGNVVVDNETVGTTMRVFDFAGAEPGEYKISVTAVASNPEKNSEPAERSFANKTLDRVAGFIVENGILIFNAVENAQKYVITVDCGNENHVHTAFNNGTSTNFFIGNCPMQDGGILITVTASAKGFADSTSEVFVYNKVLAEIEHLVYDTEKDQIVWNAVAGTADYRVKVTVGGNTYTFHNGTSTVFSLAGFTGDISVSVIPVTDGYNSPAEAVVTCKKTAPAAPAGVNITGMVISWEPVEGAVSYEVVIGDKTISTSTNRLNLADAALTLTQGQFYTVKVKAINANNEGSSYSEEMETGYFAMNPHLRYEQNTVYWMPVLGVENYQVRVNGANTQNVSAMTSASVTLTREGENIIEVRYVSGETTSDWVSLNVMAYAVEYDTRSVAYGAFYIEYLAVGDRMSLPTEGFAYDGYEFAGWYNAPKGAAGNGKLYPEGAVFTGNAYTVVYADWSPKDYCITLDIEGFDIANIENGHQEIVTYTKHFTLPVPDAGDMGVYVFAGWFTAPTGSGVQITDGMGNSLQPYNAPRDMTLYPYYSTDALEFVMQADGTFAVTRGISIKNVIKLVIPAVHNDVAVTKILEGAFNATDCNGIKTVQIPDTITLVGANAFNACKSLESIEVYKAKEGDYETFYASADGALIREDMGTTYLEIVPRGKTGHFTIPAEVDKVLTKAFYYSSIESLTIPNNVTSMPKYALFFCEKLKSISFEMGRTNPLEFDVNAFYKCKSVESIALPADLNITFGDLDFMLDQFAGLRSVEIEEGHPEFASLGGILTDHTKSTFLYAPMAYAGEVVIPKGITAVAANAFSNRDQITAVTIPIWVTSIGSSAFNGCDSVTTVLIRGARAEDLAIETSAFANMKRLATVTFEGNGTTELDEGKITIGNNAFQGYYQSGVSAQMTSVEIGAGVNIESIESRAFYNQSKMRSFNIDPVARIGQIKDYAFEKCTQLTAFTVPGTVKSIAKYAFSGCTNLSEVNFSAESATTLEIAEYAFNGCTKLISITLPDHLKSFVSTAFEGCDMLKEIKVSDTNASYLNDENGILYKKNGDSTELTELLFYPKGLAKELGGIINNLPDTLTTIGGSAFSGNHFVVSVTIPKSVTAIGTSAFAGCTKLDTLNFEAGGTALTIGSKAFMDCSSLVTVTLPDYTTTIGDSAFENCTFASFVVPAKVTTIGKAAFMNCKNLAQVTFLCDGALVIGKGASAASNGAFAGCTALTSITIPAGTTEIGKYTFYQCSGLQTVVFAEGSKLKTINSGAFSDCVALKSITIPKSVTTIGSSAFAMSESATATTLGPGLLETVTFELGGTAGLTINTSAFAYLPNLKSITFPARLTKLVATAQKPDSTANGTYHSAFSNCDNLEAIHIAVEDGIDATFSTRSGVLYNADQTVLLFCPWANVGEHDQNGDPTYELIVPNTVQLVMSNALVDCTRLKTVTFQEFAKGDSNYGKQLLTIGSYAATASSSYTTATTAYNYAAIGGKNTCSITTINLPSHLKKINGGSFANVVENPISININPDANNIELAMAAFSYAKADRITIPGTLKSISTHTFYNCSYMTEVSVTFPADLTVFPAHTFSSCLALQSYVVPAQFTKIDSNAFAKCSSMTSLVLPENLVEIGTSVFGSCGALTKLDIPKSVTKIGGRGLGGLGVETLVIPAGVKDAGLGAQAFTNCQNLKTVIFERDEKGECGITKITARMFLGCSSLEYIDLQESKITSIEQMAFHGCVSLTEKSIDFTKMTSLHTVGSQAFVQSGLVNVDLSKTKITQIIDAFSKIESLKTFRFPETIKGVDAFTFSGCPNLETIYLSQNFTADMLVAVRLLKADLEVPEGNRYLVEDEFGVVYSPNYSVIYYAGGNKRDLTGYVIPETVITIGDYAFTYVKMDSLVIPEGVTTIGYQSFRYSQIPFISIPSTMETIGQFAFDGSGVKQVEFANERNSKLKTLSANAFSNSMLESIVLPDNMNIPYNTNEGASIFSGCKYLKSVTFGAAQRETPAKIFAGCDALEEIIFQEGLEVIHYLFCGDTSVIPGATNQVKSMHIPSTVHTLDIDAFACFGKLETITFAQVSQLTTIGESAFMYCTSLKQIELVPTVQSIGKEAFYHCRSLETIDMSVSDITVIPTNAFAYTENLKTVILPEGLVTIEEKAFYHTGLVDLLIPGAVTFIGNSAFENATALKTVAFAADSMLEAIGVQEGESAVFRGCSSLEHVTLPNFLKLIGNNVFENSGVKTVTFTDAVAPVELTAIGDYAFANCAELTAIEEAKGVKQIGEAAFLSCANLESAPVYDGLEYMGAMAFGFCSKLPVGRIPATVNELSGNPYAGFPVDKIQLDVNNIYLLTETDNSGVLYLYNAVKSSLYGVYGVNGTFTISAKLGSVEAGALAGTGITEVIVEGQSNVNLDYMFMNCNWLAKATLQEGITAIGKYAFCNTGISNINIPATVKAIDDYAFASCAKLDGVVIPANTLEIGDYCFAYCTTLNNVTFEDHATDKYTTLGTHIFYNCSAMTQVALPNAFRNTLEEQIAISGYSTKHLIGAIPSYMFAGTGIVEAVLPTSVDLYYTEGVFANCKNLVRIVLMDQPTAYTGYVVDMVYQCYNGTWLDGCDQFEYFYAQHFTGDMAYILPILDRGGAYELHMDTVFSQEPGAKYTVFHSAARFNWASAQFRLYFDKATYEEIIPCFETMNNHWDIRVFDKNGYELISDEETGAVAYVLDTEGNKVWEASKA